MNCTEARDFMRHSPADLTNAEAVAVARHMYHCQACNAWNDERARRADPNSPECIDECRRSLEKFAIVEADPESGSADLRAEMEGRS